MSTSMLYADLSSSLRGAWAPGCAQGRGEQEGRGPAAARPVPAAESGLDAATAAWACERPVGPERSLK